MKRGEGGEKRKRESGKGGERERRIVHQWVI